MAPSSNIALRMPPGIPLCTVAAEQLIEGENE
jgi:hypothetical protein